jgi:hypothetical protein
LAGLALAACGTVRSSSSTVASNATTGVTIDLRANGNNAAPIEEMAAMFAAVAPAAAPPPADIARLTGVNRDALRDLLGPASFVRRDGPAEIWRYAAEDCYLDVFLYRERDGFQVSYVEARPRGAARVTPRSCYAQLDAARRRRPTG